MHSPLRSPLERIERAGRNLMAAALGLLLAATVGGLVFPSQPTKIDGNPSFRPIARASMGTRLKIPSLQVDAAVVPISLDTHADLTPPDDPSVLGWWDGSALPGSKNGQTVITGHTVHNGGGQMDHLGSIEQGAIIQIDTAEGTLWYRETQLLILTKAEVSARADELFSQAHKPNRLVLITCTGWTGHSYTGNVVVFADPLGVPISSSPSPKR